MATKVLSLQVRPRGKPIRKLPETVQISSISSPAELYQQLARTTQYSPHQLRVTKGSDGSLCPNTNSGSIHDLGLRNESTVYVKDLGTQVAWRTVFIVEYLGPLLVHPLAYVLRPYLYSSAPRKASQLQTLTCALICLHFLKRELETIFVHRFSAATMPLPNIFKNSAHYWILAGVNIAAWIYAPSSPTASEPSQLLLASGLALYALGELVNLQVHLQLRGLRSAGSGERGIPRGWLFDLVTCPNYLAETVSWIGVYLVSGLSWSVVLFLLVSVGQMMPWAVKKETRYRKEFGDKYKQKRYTMLPGIW